MNSNNIIKYIFLFIIGGFSYFYIEILFRGFSHFSMIICGGLAFILCGALNQFTHFKLSVITQMLISSIIITLLEFITGYIVNIRLHWNVWDYSSLPYNYQVRYVLHIPSYGCCYPLFVLLSMT